MFKFIYRVIEESFEEKDELNQCTEIQKCEKIEVEKPNEELENKKIESTEKNEENIHQKENIKIDFKQIVSQILYVVKFIFCSFAFFSL